MLDFQSRKSLEDLSTKITMIVYWGLVIVGLVFASLLLSNIEEDTLEKRTYIVDSIAYKVSLKQADAADKQTSIVHILKEVINEYNNLDIEIFIEGELFAYANKMPPSELVDTIVHPLSLPGLKDEVVELHVIFPQLEGALLSERKRLLLTLGTLLIVFGVILKLVLERLIKRPVDKMVFAAQAISSGDMNVKFDEDRGDEFGYLSSFMNEAIRNTHRQEREAWNAKELAEVTLESISDGVVTTDENGKVVFMNSCAESMSGRNLDDEKGKHLAEVMPLVNEGVDELARHPVFNCLSDDASIDLKINCALMLKNGSHLDVSSSLAPIHSNDGEVLGVVMVFQDVSEARALHQELSYQAAHDHLTGLYNRRELEHELQHSLARAHRDGDEHILCYLDLDQFKIVNDTCGHAAGDMLLRKLAEYLQKTLRRTDVLARLGGDEFALLLSQCSIAEAEKVAENLLKKINNFRFNWKERQFQIGASIGVATMTSDSVDALEVLSNADMACYAAKEAGRNRVHIYQSDDQNLKDRRTEMGMISYVREALEKDRFELFAQPIVSTMDVNDRRHFEVLVRMKSSEGKLIMPGAFLPAAERYNVMPEIDRWVVSNVLKYMAAENKNFSDYSLAINISGQSINDESFLEFIIGEIVMHNIDASRLCFEITETEAVSNMDHAISFIEVLKEHKCKFSLDDFGTGVSSFEYLKNLPVDYLKIDGAFIKQIDINKVDYAMVRAINEVATVMGMKTIAEFVENEESYNILKEIGIDYAQGYWIQKPDYIAKIIRGQASLSLVKKKH
jgi:diguanylate cyclase (GGDEF)-like protein/PAS domain S-box-containing protein